MDKQNNKPEPSQDELIKKQEDLQKLMQVLDECIEKMDYFYYYMKAKELLTLSKDN